MDKSVDGAGVVRRYGVFLPAANPTFRNPDFDAASFRILIVRLSPFTDVERSTPHLFLAGCARKAAPGAYVDMAFFPSDTDRRFLRANQLDFMTGVQSLRSVRDFDLVLISNSFLLELINLPAMLRQSGLEVWASMRDGVRPLIILGGSNAMASQAVIKDNGDCMADAVFFGEAEGRIEQIVKAAEAGSCRRDRLVRLTAGNISGLWIAGSFSGQLIEKAVLDEPTGGDICTGYPVLNGEEVSTGRIQISHGCPAFCSFCFEGYDRKPYRETQLAELLAAARELKRSHGCRDIDLYSFNFNTYTHLLELLLELNRLFDTVSLKSQRVDILAEDPALLSVEVLAGKRSFTLGIEGISDRCRAMLHKSLSGSAVNTLMERLLQERIREIKLFYILTGYESEADIAEFRAFVRRCKDLVTSHNRGLRVIFSFGMLVRMPGTPFQFDSLMLDPGPWQKLERKICAACENEGFEFRMAMTWQEYAVTQVMALGGYWLSEPILALEQEGFIYDRGLPALYWERLKEWMNEHGLLAGALAGEKEVDYSFALSFVRQRIEKTFIYDKFRMVKAAQDSGYCLGRVSGRGVCLDCGACLSGESRQKITAKRAPVPVRGAFRDELADLFGRKSRLGQALIMADIPEEFAGATAEWLNAAIMRQILGGFPEEADNILSVRELMFAPSGMAGTGQVRFYGQSVFAIKAWRLHGLLEKLKNVQQNGGVSVSVMDQELGQGRAVDLVSAWLDFTVSSSGSDGESRPEDLFASFMRTSHVPFTLRKSGLGYQLEITGNRRSRDIVAGGYYQREQGSTSFRLMIGPRFELDVLGRCYGGRLGNVRISGLTVRVTGS